MGEDGETHILTLFEGLLHKIFQYYTVYFLDLFTKIISTKTITNLKPYDVDEMVIILVPF